MSIRTTTTVLVLCAVFATAHSAKEWHEGVLFSNLATVDAASTRTATKVSGSPNLNYQAPQLRQICLQEVERKECKAYGCPYASKCSTGCSDCITEYSSQNVLACCKDKDYYGEAASGGLTPPSVGSCDWTFAPYKCDQAVYGVDCYLGFTLRDTAVEKYATVWATCYFNSNSEGCGDPLCARTVMSIQGGAYAMPAYIVGTNDSLIVPPVDESCRDETKRVEGMLAKSAVHSKRMHGAQNVINAEQQGQKTSGDAGETLYTPVMAFVVSGPVTATSLEHHMDYDRGVLEWVAEVVPIGDPQSAPPTGLNPVVPYTMTVTLASSGGRDDSYPS